MPARYFSNFGSLKSTETAELFYQQYAPEDFSNFGSLKSTETRGTAPAAPGLLNFSNFGSLKSTETCSLFDADGFGSVFQQFRLVEEH